MCSTYPGIKLEPALQLQEYKIEHLSSYTHVVRTKRVISRCRKNKDVCQPRSQGLSSLPPLSLTQRQWRQRRETLGTRLGRLRAKGLFCLLNMQIYDLLVAFVVLVDKKIYFDQEVSK